MTKPEAFWDASALIPICTRQPTTPSVHRLAAQFSCAVWWGSPVEIHSGIARLLRTAEIDSEGKRQSLRALAALCEGWNEIYPSELLREHAFNVLATYPLRAADSLQLAAALIWCNNKPTNRTFITADIRLADAATLAGFTVITP